MQMNNQEEISTLCSYEWSQTENTHCTLAIVKHTAIKNTVLEINGVVIKKVVLRDK